jgi:oligopeptide transport system ATP-binding protein
MSKTKLLELKNVCKHYPIRKGILSRIAGYVHAVDGVSFSIYEGETLGLVGESGCGKSVTAMSLVSLLPSPPSKREKGSILLSGREIAGLSENELQKIRGAEVGFIFQEPMSSLNPVLTIGYQLTEAILLHQKISKSQSHERAVEMLNLVGVSDPEIRMKQHPHELSGGMRQRIMIAMALACDPEILIA